MVHGAPRRGTAHAGALGQQLREPRLRARLRALRAVLAPALGLAQRVPYHRVHTWAMALIALCFGAGERNVRERSWTASLRAS